jgi:molybdate transport system substrate-binding protein
VRRRLATLAALALVATAGCTEGAASDESAQASGTGADAELTGTLTVFAAASLTDVFPELGDELVEDNPSLQVEFNFAGSSALAAQLLQGAPADVFAAADPIQMARVVDGGLATDPLFFAGNPLMLAFPPDDPAGIAARRTENDPTLDDLLDVSDTLAVCAPEVPCGAAAATLLAAAGLQNAPDTYEDDARAVLTKVQLGEVDAGLVYLSDVHAAGDTIRALAFPDASTAINRYPLAVLTDAPNPSAAQAFADLVHSDAGQQILREAGFLEP